MVFSALVCVTSNLTEDVNSLAWIILSLVIVTVVRLKNSSVVV